MGDQELARLLERYSLRLQRRVVGVLWGADNKAIPVVVEDAAPLEVNP
jgi:hypothetical protein